MEACDFTTISEPGEAVVREKMSRFIAFAMHAASAGEARAIINDISGRYHDARHVCWAYTIGASRTEFLSSDNGEPSGTAGKPILGQINSAGITDAVVVVVRYFGGIKLGPSGLIAAYRQAAREAIAAATLKNDCVRKILTATFSYAAMNGVMKVVKASDVSVVEQVCDNSCSISLSVRTDQYDDISRRLRDAEATVK